MKTVSVRFYSPTNFGDDLLVDTLVKRYSNQFKVIHSAKRGPFRNSENVSSSDNFLLENAKRLIHGVKTKLGRPYVNFNAKHCDLLVYVGGSIFIEGNNLPKWRKELEFYRTLKKPYFIIGSNIGPFESPEFLEIVKHILSGAQDVCVRDDYSYQLVKDLPNVRVGSDIVFSLNPSEYSVRQEKTAVFSIIDGTSRFDPTTTDKYEESIISMTQKLLMDGFEVVYMSFCKSEGDEDAISRILGKLNEDIRQNVRTHYYAGNLDSSMTLLASCELVIASRFHASILGFVLGKKVLPMAYSDKMINVLNDMEYSGPYIDIRTIDQFNFNEIVFQEIPIADVSTQKSLAEKQFEKLDEILEKNTA